MSNPKLVRIKDPDSGVERTVGAQFAKNKGITPLSKPAVDAFGRALPAKRDPLHRQQAALTANSLRADLEDAARKAGISEDQITSASNRQALVDLIDSQEG